MPYPANEIPSEYHKPYCSNPKTIALHERVSLGKGKRTWVVRVLKCSSCGVQISLPNKYNTKKQNDSILALSKILSEKERLESTKDLKLKPIRTKDVQPVISPKEKRYRAKVKALNKMYKNDEKFFPRLKGKINWDPKLVDKFLDARPTFAEITTLLNWPPLSRDNNRYANKNRGWIPNPENFGYTKYDHDCYNIKWGKDPGLIDLNKLSECEKLILAEKQERSKYMKNIIEKHLESDIQIYYPAEDEDKKERSKNRIRKSIS